MSTLNSVKKETRQEVQIAMLRNKFKLALLTHPAVKEELARIPARYRNAENIKITAALSADYYGRLSIYITIKNITSLKTDKRLLKLLEIYASDLWTAKTDDYTYGTMPERTFRFKREVHGLTDFFPQHLRTQADKIGADVPYTLYVSVDINAIVKGDSDTCRLVTVGKKEVVRIEEVKEIVCN